MMDKIINQIPISSPNSHGPTRQARKGKLQVAKNVIVLCLFFAVVNNCWFFLIFVYTYNWYK